MAGPLQIWLLGDGRTGHLNQSLGLAEAIGRKTPAQVEKLALPSGSTLRRIRDLGRITSELPAPDLLLGAGHRTHLPLIWLCRKTAAKTVVLMKPTLPTGLFDLCMVPRHDLTRAEPPANVIPTIGALNKVLADPNAKRDDHLILVGGPSGQHGWDGDPLASAIGKIVGDGSSWEITDSRRTPDGFLESLEKAAPQLTLHPHQQTGPDWLPGKLSTADSVWVTEDSVSMVCEALTAGARVGILPMPRTRKRSRVVRGLQMLVDDGYVTTLDQWRATGELTPAPEPLAEADRCAAILLDRLFPNR
jgi:mitochondrial fission protein ELM1